MNRRKIAWTVSLVVAGGLFAAFAVRIVVVARSRRGAEQTDVERVSVRVAPAVRRDVTERVLLTGTVRPRREVDVFTKLPGRVEQMLVKVGDRVTAGQGLAVVEHREIEWQNRQAGAQAQAAAAALDQARANAEAAETQYRRFQALKRDSTVSEAEFERVQTGSRAAQAGLRAAEAQVALTRAAAGLAGEALRNSRITSPIAGTVTRRTADVGTQVSPMQPMFQVQDVVTLKLEGTVSAEEFARLSVGQGVRLRIDDLGGVAFTGSIATLSPTLDPMTRRAAVEVSIDNSEGRLLPNMLARAEIDVAERRGALVVPAAAVVALPTGRVVYVVRDGHAQAVRPRLGAGDGDSWIVEDGVSENDRIVVSGQTALTDGAEVNVVEATGGVGGGRP